MYIYNKQGLKQESKNPFILNNLGSSLFFLKRYDEANRIFDQAIQQNDQFLEAIINKANVYVAQDNLSEAMKLLNRATKIKESPFIYNALGIVAHK